MHIGDLDGSASLSRNKWDASVKILVHDANENPIAGVTQSLLTYASLDNHDPDGDSNGTSLIVYKP